MSNAPTPSPPSPMDKEYAESRRVAVARLLAVYAGLFHIMFSALIAIGVYRYVASTQGNAKDFSFYQVSTIVTALLVALTSAVMGTRVMLRDASTPKIVIPPEDRSLLEDLIRNANEKAIDQYVRLSSLSGTTGTATKLGLTGLPLATVGLTLFFSIIALFKVDGFLDLAKLTLGAFIGSFVQRNISGQAASSEGIRVFNSSNP